MLEALLANAGIRDRFERVVSVGTVRAFKPSPSTYRLACEALGLTPQKVLLVSSKGFDLHGRRPLRTANRTDRAQYGRCPPRDYRRAGLDPPVGVLALRSQLEVLGSYPTIVVPSLTDLVDAIGH
jgi:2-haloacid dehalogenase